MLSTAYFGGISEFLEGFHSWQKKFVSCEPVSARSPVVMSSGSILMVLVLLSTLGPAPHSHIVVDWSDAEIQGLSQAVGNDQATNLLRGCKLHWGRSWGFMAAS